MKTEVKTQDMLDYIQGVFTMYLEEREQYGPDERGVRRLFFECLGMKKMVENLIGVPVNLQKDGKVTTGF